MSARSRDPGGSGRVGRPAGFSYDHRSDSIRLMLLRSLALGTLLMVACSSGSASPSSTSTSATEGVTITETTVRPAVTTSTVVSTTTTAAPGTTTTTASASLIEVVVAGGEIETDLRHEVPLGETVAISVTSDVADEVHVHTYDVVAEVSAGGTVVLEFEATIPGIFEVELESSRLQILELVVQ